MDDLKKTVLRIEYKLDKVIEDQSQIKEVQVSQAADLKYHITRTQLNEDRIEMMESKLLPLVEIKTKAEGAFLVIGKIGSGLALLFGAVKAIETAMSLLK